MASSSTENTNSVLRSLELLQQSNEKGQDLIVKIISNNLDTVNNSIKDLTEQIKIHNGRLGKVEHRVDKVNRYTGFIDNLLEKWYLTLLAVIGVFYSIHFIVDGDHLTKIIMLLINKA